MPRLRPAPHEYLSEEMVEGYRAKLLGKKGAENKNGNAGNQREPPGFKKTESGLYLIEKERDTWLAAPFEILGRARDPKGDGWSRLLEWKDEDGNQHTCTISDADLHHDASELCGRLASQGLKIGTGNCHAHFVRYLNNAPVPEGRYTTVPRENLCAVKD